VTKKSGSSQLATGSFFEHPILYAILDSDVCHARRLDPLAVAEACLRGGATLLQLRHKSNASGPFLDLAERVVPIARQRGGTVIVNDRADIAALSGADGVHVGQEDLSVEDARHVVGATAIVGLSTHTPAQVDAALATSATYVAVGPLFGTTTKETGYDARGLELVRYASGKGKPVVAIGGITLARAPEVIAAGAWAVAVITDLLATGDVEQRAREYLAALGR
jgi:thiamine-phosphate pyrophosphorylase